jgi:hypothetical protein
LVILIRCQRFLENVDRFLVPARLAEHHAEVRPDKAEARRLLCRCLIECERFVVVSVLSFEKRAMKQRERTARMRFLNFREQFRGLHIFALLNRLGQFLNVARGIGKTRPRRSRRRVVLLEEFNSSQQLCGIKLLLRRILRGGVSRPRNAVREPEKIEFPRGAINPDKRSVHVQGRAPSGRGGAMSTVARLHDDALRRMSPLTFSAARGMRLRFREG